MGEGNSHKPMSEEVEAKIMEKLSKCDLYPQIVNTFKGGRIEQFISGRTLTIKEINSLPLILILMKKVAAIHSMKDMPSGKGDDDERKPLFTFETFDKYLKDLRDVKPVIRNEIEEEAKEFVTKSMKFEEEYRFLHHIFQHMNSRVVFIHNDLHKDNVMIDSKEPVDQNNNNINVRPEDIRIMDYEYSGYNYRSVDLAILLNEMSFQSYDEEKDCLTVPEVSEEIVRQTIHCYLKEWKSLNPDDFDERVDNVDHLVHEISIFRLIHSYARILFFCAYVSRYYGPMQCWTYTRTRVKHYFRAKHDFLSKYGQTVELL